jgi:hypothetical protein
MSKYIKFQENIYDVYLKLKSHKKQQDFLEKCFIFAWKGEEIESKNDSVNMAFLGVKPSLKIYETSVNWGGIRENAGRKINQDDNQVDNQVGIKSKSSSLKEINNKEISNKEINYKFKGSVIKLNEKDYSAWKERFNLLDFDFELEKRDIWLSGQENVKDWFISTQQYFLTLQRNKEKAREEERRLLSSWWRE